MVDALKIAAKVALIVIITAGIIALFTSVQIPNVDFTAFTQAIGAGLAVIYHWVPITRVLFPVVLMLFGFEIALRVFQIGMIGVRWIMKVNE